PRAAYVSRRQKRAGAFDQVARPREVVAAEVVVALVEPPGNRQAGDHSTAKALLFMRLQHRSADPIVVESVHSDLAEIEALRLILLPAALVALGDNREILQEGGARPLTGFGGVTPECQSENKCPSTPRDIDRAREGDVAVGCIAIGPKHALV